MERHVRIRTAGGKEILDLDITSTEHALHILDKNRCAPFAPYLCGLTPQHFGFRGYAPLSAFYAAAIRGGLSLCYPTDVFQVGGMSVAAVFGVIYVGMIPQRCPDNVHRVLICEADHGVMSLAALSADVVDCETFFLFRTKHPAP